MNIFKQETTKQQNLQEEQESSDKDVLDVKSGEPNFLYSNSKRFSAFYEIEVNGINSINSNNSNNNNKNCKEYEHKLKRFKTSLQNTANINLRCQQKDYRRYKEELEKEYEKTQREKSKRKYTKRKNSEKSATSIAKEYKDIDPKNVYFTKSRWEVVNETNKLLLKEWCMDMRARKVTLNSISQYEGDAKLVFIYMLLYQENKTVLEMTLRDWKIYTLFLIDSGVSNSRVNRMLSTVRCMLAFAEESEMFPEYVHSQATRLHGVPKEKTREIVFIEDTDFMKVYKYLMKIGMYQEATLWALAYESAGRKTELSQVKKEFVTDERDCTNVVIGKRGKKFNLIYFDLTKKAAKKWLQYRKDHNIDNSEMLFVDIKTGEALEPDKIYKLMTTLRPIFTDVTGKVLAFNVHSMRHSALENYSNGTHEVCRQKKIKDIPIEKLKHISHHSSIEVCSSYLKDKSISELEGLFGINLD